MGLDQYGGWLNEPTKEEILHTKIVNEPEYVEIVEFDWRKHAKLQKFMEDLFYTEYDDGEDTFNYGTKLYLEEKHILDLKKLIENNSLPESEGGFFYGHQFQDDSAKEYKEQDLDFCEKALKWLEEGKKVFYECSW